MFSELAARARTARWWVGALLLSTGILIWMPRWACAQTPAHNQMPGDSLKREEDRLRSFQQSITPEASTLKLQPQAGRSSTLPQEAPCFVVHRIVLEGERAYRFAWLKNELADDQLRCVGQQGLNVIVRRLNDTLIALGYATSRVSLVPQNLQSGELRLHLHVGWLSQVRITDQDGKPDEAWGTWRNAMPLSEGSIVNVHDIEQGLEQMKRLPSQAVTSELTPGEQPDSSVLTLHRKEGPLGDRLHGGITVDNSGTEILGKPQLAAYATLDNPTGLSDILSLSANSNLEHLSSAHRSQSVGLSYSVPWGFNTVTLSANWARFAQYVAGTTAVFLSSGQSRSTDLKLERVLWRTASSKFGVYGDVALRRSSSFLNDVELTIQDRRTTNLETGVSYQQLFGPATMLDLQAGFRHGVGMDGAQDDLAGADQGGPSIRPHLWLLNANFRTRFQLRDRSWQWSTLLRAQQTPQLLTSTDQFGLGSRYTVRGFDGNNILLSDGGINLRNELSSKFDWMHGVDTSLVMALDWGRLWGRSTVNLVGDQLAGAAVGMRGSAGPWRTEVMLATPLKYPAGFITSHFNVYASLTRGF